MKIRRILPCSHYAYSLVFTSLILSACTAPYPKASYELIQPQNPEVEFLSSPNLTGWAKFKGCYISFDAKSKDDGFEFSLTRKHIGPVCTYSFDQGPIVIEAKGSNTRYEIEVFHRMQPAVLSIDEKVDLASISPGYAAVPEKHRQYALSFDVRQLLNQASLPEVFKIKIPQIRFGEQDIEIPMISFERYKKSGDGWWYVPKDVGQVKGTEPMGRAFGSLFKTMVFKPADVLYEDDTVRLSGAFRGDQLQFARDALMVGTIYLEVLDGKPVELFDKEFIWSIPGDETGEFRNESISELTLEKYSTSLLTENPDPFPIYSRKDRIIVPKFKSKRFKVTLPTIQTNGNVWPIRTFEFKGR